jgi:AcrR family transcriptional regulator
MSEQRSVSPLPQTPPTGTHVGATTRRTRSDGARSRQAILDAAARLATIEGLNGLSIGELAKHIGMSKSGLYAHFRSKEELQLATINVAGELYDAEIIRPALLEPNPLARLTALCDNFLSHVQHWPGGCFFASAAAELDTQPGKVRDRIASFQSEWMAGLIQQISEAQADGSLDTRTEPAQLAFEINAMLHLANSLIILHRDPAVIARAQLGINDRLSRAGAQSGTVPTGAS